MKYWETLMEIIVCRQGQQFSHENVVTASLQYPTFFGFMFILEKNTVRLFTQLKLLK